MNSEVKDTYRIAVPSMAPGGMNASRSGHFGRCDCFTLIDIKNGKPDTINIIDNPPHVEGGCLAPVMLLAEHDVDAIIVQGMGMRPWMGFNQSGISVLLGTGETVEDSVQALIDGQLSPMTSDSLCGGH